MILCRRCHERPISPSRERLRDYCCGWCRSRTPAARAAQHRWRQTPNGKDCNARTNARRIYVGRDYHSCAATTEQAVAINTHIKERRRAFVAR